MDKTTTNPSTTDWAMSKNELSAIHKWMDSNYGKEKVCEGLLAGLECRGTATWYDWAKKTGMQYFRSRENFFRLCRSCHRRYDLTEEKKKQGTENLWWKKGAKAPGRTFDKIPKEEARAIAANGGRTKHKNARKAKETNI